MEEPGTDTIKTSPLAWCPAPVTGHFSRAEDQSCPDRLKTGMKRPQGPGSANEISAWPPGEVSAVWGPA